MDHEGTRVYNIIGIYMYIFGCKKYGKYNGWLSNLGSNINMIIYAHIPFITQIKLGKYVYNNYSYHFIISKNISIIVFIS